MAKRPCEHVAGVWSVEGHDLPFRACLTFADGKPDAIEQRIERIDVRIDHDSEDLSEMDHDWLHREEDTEARLQPDLQRAAADTYNLLAWEGLSAS